MPKRKPNISRYLIYFLSDPRGGPRGYVGKSSSGLQRPKAHKWPSQHDERHNKMPVICWVKSLLKNNINYKITILEELDNHEKLNEAEIFWIQYYRLIGFKLLNVTDGGEGRPGAKHTKEMRLNNSRKHGGRSFQDHLGNIYDTQGEAARAIGTRKGKIGETLRNKLKTIKGYTFWYLGESAKPTPITDDFEKKKAASQKMGGSEIIDQFGTIYPSIAEAARKIGRTSGSILGVLKGKIKQTKGYHFKYLDKNKVFTCKERCPAKPIVDQYGNVYKSIYDAAKKLNIKKTNIGSIIRGQAKSAKGYTFKCL